MQTRCDYCRVIFSDPDYLLHACPGSRTAGITHEKLAEMEAIARDIANIHYKVDVTRLVAEVRRLQAFEAAVKELRAMDDAWLRRHPHYRRPKNLVLPHDKLYMLLDASAQTKTSR